MSGKLRIVQFVIEFFGEQLRGKVPQIPLKETHIIATSAEIGRELHEGHRRIFILIVRLEEEHLAPHCRASSIAVITRSRVSSSSARTFSTAQYIL